MRPLAGQLPATCYFPTPRTNLPWGRLLLVRHEYTRKLPEFCDQNVEHRNVARVGPHQPWSFSCTRMPRHSMPASRSMNCVLHRLCISFTACASACTVLKARSSARACSPRPSLTMHCFMPSAPKMTELATQDLGCPFAPLRHSASAATLHLHFLAGRHGTRLAQGLRHGTRLALC